MEEIDVEGANVTLKGQGGIVISTGNLDFCLAGFYLRLGRDDGRPVVDHIIVVDNRGFTLLVDVGNVEPFDSWQIERLSPWLSALPTR